MATPETTPDVRIFEDSEAVARAATERFIELAREAIDARSRFSVALAGGSTPKRVYELLASDEFKDQVDWAKVHIFFGDERCVPPDHHESNYRMAREALLAQVMLPLENVHRMIGEGDAVANARLYEDELRQFFDGAQWPQLDLVMLGMGDDGHTASLFPGSRALHEDKAWVTANWVEKFSTFRITLTAPAINHAAHIMFIVTGAGKTDRLPEVLKGPRETDRLPSQLIHPVNGTLEWFTDKAAAAKLSN
ncbi:MAG: 6-phosphogluconolactonase [Acidobacteria bacterium]|nr:MAG: 6-phosphogluconolactonase [Acidobacteriota bacterium]